MAEHYLDDSITQPFWDNSVEPRLEIDPGDVVVFECAEPVGQLTPDSTDDDLANLDFSLIHALNGSVFIKGAEPGDALEVEIMDMQIARLFVGDLAGTRRTVHDGKIFVPGHLHDGFSSGIEGEQVELAVAVGSKIDPVVDPHGIGVVAPALGLGDLFDGMISPVIEPDARSRAAAVVFPLVEGFPDGRVGDPFSVR